MTSPFFGLEIGLRGLRTWQTMVNITNNNIANADTPGYSRQSGQVQSTPSYPAPSFNAIGKPGQLGTGVEVASITRARDIFIDAQIRSQKSIEGSWDTKRDALSQVEAIVNEPSSSGLSSLLTKYWNSWQDVANNPADSAVRANLVEQGVSLASSFQNLHNQLQQQQRDLDGQVVYAVDQVNTFAQQIASINQQIGHVEFDGTHANDLRDQRDLLLDQLSQFAKISYVESPGGMVSVYLGGRQLVDRDVANALTTAVPGGQTWTQIQWKSDGQAASITDGTIKGMLDSRDTILQGRMNDLDVLATRVVNSVNSVHSSGVGLDGVGGRNFFVGTGAGNMAVDSALTGPGGAEKVAAARMYPDTTSSTGYSFARGDSSNAVALAQLESTITQASTSSGLQPGTNLGGVTIFGVDLARAAVNSSISMSVPAGSSTVTFTSSAGASATGALTVGTDASGNQVVTVEGTSLGVRLTLVAPSSMSLSSVLAPLNGQSVAAASRPSTIGDQYGQQIAALGVDSKAAQNQAQNQQVLVSQLQKQREQTSGVSLDEESTHLIEYQRAYQAAARVITTADEMLNTLINGTGLVGRG